MTSSTEELAFPRTEYQRRLAAVRAEMQRREVDALIVSDRSNITYLSGYTAKSSYVPQGLVISAYEEPTFFLRRQDAPAAVRQTYLNSDAIIGYPEALVGSSEKDGYDAVIDFLHEAGLADRAVGLELGTLPAQSVEKFKSRLAKATIIDCTKAVTWLRIVKSELEIAAMKESAAIADAAMARAAEVIRAGVREADATAEILATLVRGANGKPSTDIASYFLCASPHTGTPHIRWSEGTFQNGSQVNLELGGVRHGYTAALMRTFSVGAPQDRLRRLHEAEVAGLEAALEIVRPGATCGDVATAFNRTIGKYGFEKESRCGYAIGIDWLEPTASLKEGDPTVLKPNMTFHLMLGNWVDDDFGYVLSETFRVTGSGVEVLTSTPRELLEL